MKSSKKLKVLWFTNIEIEQEQLVEGYNGGGWMTALLKKIKHSNEFQLSVSFISNSPKKDFQNEGVQFLPINFDDSYIEKAKRVFSQELQIARHLEAYKSIIDKCNPDIIHVFGSEQPFGLVCEDSKVPVLLHVQGTLMVYQNSFFPPGFSKANWLTSDGYNPISILKKWLYLQGFSKSVDIEKRIYKSIKYVMGRTDWDKRLAEIYSNSIYLHCDELLRDEFYCGSEFIYDGHSEEIKIISTISSPPYKGADVILKSAKILVFDMGLKISWTVFGLTDMNVATKMTGIDPKLVGVSAGGIVSARQLKDELLGTNLYVHPAYIENGCISVSEARVLGVPVIACGVGGVTSTIQHKVSGILVPSNEPHIIASWISELHTNRALAKQIGVAGRVHALSRHNPDVVVKQVTDAYLELS
jgi:glycosyltransferase involved in cell wall biosynthesis